jgi:hypothetical protein
MYFAFFEFCASVAPSGVANISARTSVRCPRAAIAMSVD